MNNISDYIYYWTNGRITLNSMNQNKGIKYIKWWTSDHRYYVRLFLFYIYIDYKIGSK